MNPLIGMLVEPITGLLDKFIPDADTKAQLAYEIATLTEKQAHAAALAQIEINKLDAKSGNWFQAGWRPAVGWVCVIAMANNFIILPYALAISENIVPMDWAAMSPVLLGMLGLATNRTVEKLKGKA